VRSVSGSFVVAFDVGTSGVKAVLADMGGRVAASRYEPYGLRCGDGGEAEQDLDEIYGRLGAASRTLLDTQRVAPERIEAVSVTAQMFNLVPFHAAGEPLAPMLSWLDTRSAPQAQALAARVDAAEQFQRFDAIITAKDVIPKILWLQEERPDLWARTAKLLDCKEAMVALLTGAFVTDHAGASAFRLADLEAGGWDEDRCRLAGLRPSLLPEVAAATEVAGRLTDAAAAETGLLAGTPVMVGAGDVPASQVGAGAVEHGDAHVSLGTAVYFGITLDRPLADPGRQLGVLGHMDPKRFILWLEIATGGGALAWLLRVLGGAGSALGHAEVDRLVAERMGEGGSLLFLPWLSGERVPLFDDHARAAFVGLDLHHDHGHLALAVMEGVAHQMRWALEYAEAFGEPVGTLRAVGGGGIGASWTQVIANVLGRPLETIRDPQDAAARGAAACALVGLGARPGFGFLKETVEVERTVTPDAAHRPRHDHLHATYQALYHALAPIYRTVRTAGGS
jgi:xylulokinase